MKKLINAPTDVVRDALSGMALAYPQLSIDLEHRIIVRADAPVPRKVGVLSGGGSGHEPLHGGFVGPGMLDAACAGEVFTSPPPNQILEATRRVDAGAGVLYIVKNYTGDVLNFEMAAELARAEGIDVQAIVIDDDVAVQDSLYTAGRRGVGGTVLLERICGAAAEQGSSLPELVELGRKVIANVRSMGIALSSCTVPTAGRPTFELGDDEIEVGIGVHGEPGRYRQSMVPAPEIAALLLQSILEDMPLAARETVLLFVNGMGATPLLELYIMVKEVSAILDEHGIRVARTLVGPYMTALDMAGCSVTILRLDEQLTRLWDTPVATPGLSHGG